MQYLLCNGSPRGAKGATGRIIESLAKGLESTSSPLPENSSNPTDIGRVLLNRVHEHTTAATSFAAADRAVIVFPLYTDGMPGMTMAFIEALRPYTGQLHHMTIAYIVQSGFPEKTHCEAIAKYLERLTEILGATYAGTAIFGGGMSLYGKRLGLVSKLGHSFATTGRFDTALLAKTTPMQKIPLLAHGPLRLLSKTPLLQLFWIQQLKENGAYKKRFDRPYGE